MKKKSISNEILFGIIFFVSFWIGWFRIESAIIFLATTILYIFEDKPIKIKIIKK